MTCIILYEKYYEKYSMRNIMSRITRFIIVTFWSKTSSTVHLKKSDEAGLCVGDFSLQESCFISPRKRADLRREKYGTGPGGRKRENFETASTSRRVKKDFFYRRPLFF